MIVAHEHSPVLVACVWRETKARSSYARNLTSFALCYYVIGLFNKVQTNHKHKRKRMWFGCEQPFLWVEHCVTSQKTAAEETTIPPVYLQRQRFIDPPELLYRTLFLSAFSLPLYIFRWSRSRTTTVNKLQRRQCRLF